MKKDHCKISEAEWVVMDILWNSSPLTTTTIIEALRPVSDWSPKTIHSLISRLVAKGALEVNKNSSPYQYHPLISKQDCVKNETKSFIKRFYNDSISLLFAHFIKDEGISPSELEKLKQILDEKSE